MDQGNETVECEVPREVTTIPKTPTFRRDISSPFLGKKNNSNNKLSRNRQQAGLPTASFWFSSLAYSYILKMEAADSTESLVHIFSNCKELQPRDPFSQEKYSFGKFSMWDKAILIENESRSRNYFQTTAQSFSCCGSTVIMSMQTEIATPS
jgi:hypothetical protein